MMGAHRMSVAGTLALMISCSDSAGPSPVYPELPDAVRAAACVRGNLTVGQSAGSTMDALDCDQGFHYYETYVVKVVQDRAVDILMTPQGFDAYLLIAQITSFTADSLYYTIIGEDDDGISGVNGRISQFDLSAGLDYLVIAGGINYADTGQYVLRVQ